MRQERAAAAAAGADPGSANQAGRSAEAVEVLELKPKVNKEGVLIEQRAIGKFYNEGTREFYVVLFWREGRSVRKIISRSYIHVIEFEKQNL